MRKKDLLVYVFIIVAVAWWLHFCKDVHPCYCETVITHTDTIYRTDTIRDTVPKLITRYVVRVDSVSYAVSDTITLYVPLTVERKEYKTEEYRAVVEGVNPKLTFIETYNKITGIETTKYIRQKDKRFGLGLQIGSGYDFTNGRTATYVGVGLQYNLIRW